MVFGVWTFLHHVILQKAKIILIPSSNTVKMMVICINPMRTMMPERPTRAAAPAFLEAQPSGGGTKDSITK